MLSSITSKAQTNTDFSSHAVDCIICFDMVYRLCSDTNINANTSCDAIPTTDFRFTKLLNS